MIIGKNIEEVNKIVSTALQSLQEDRYYGLYADEGGQLGIPAFIASNKSQNTKQYEYIGNMSKYAIFNYIVGRLCAWQIGNSADYSKKIKITVQI